MALVGVVMAVCEAFRLGAYPQLAVTFVVAVTALAYAWRGLLDGPLQLEVLGLLRSKSELLRARFTDSNL